MCPVQQTLPTFVFFEAHNLSGSSEWLQTECARINSSSETAAMFSTWTFGISSVEKQRDIHSVKRGYLKIWAALVQTGWSSCVGWRGQPQISNSGKSLGLMAEWPQIKHWKPCRCDGECPITARPLLCVGEERVICWDNSHCYPWEKTVIISVVYNRPPDYEEVAEVLFKHLAQIYDSTNGGF